ncbi:MAG: hypothetical protein AB7H90_01540 [Alphaproteobacteria bacterium]
MDGSFEQYQGGDFAAHIASERDRLRAEREQIFNQQEELQRRLDEINREFAAIEAYEHAKTGKSQKPARTGNSAAPRARRGSVREVILQTVAATEGGASRGELLEALGMKGDKSGEMSISNALTALTKSGQLVRDGRVYRLPSDASTAQSVEQERVLEPAE